MAMQYYPSIIQEFSRCLFQNSYNTDSIFLD